MHRHVFSDKYLHFQATISFLQQFDQACDSLKLQMRAKLNKGTQQSLDQAKSELKRQITDPLFKSTGILDQISAYDHARVVKHIIVEEQSDILSLFPELQFSNSKKFRSQLKKDSSFPVFRTVPYQRHLQALRILREVAQLRKLQTKLLRLFRSSNSARQKEIFSTLASLILRARRQAKMHLSNDQLIDLFRTIYSDYESIKTTINDINKSSLMTIDLDVFQAIVEHIRSRMAVICNEWSLSKTKQPTDCDHADWDPEAASLITPRKPFLPVHHFAQIWWDHVRRMSQIRNWVTKLPEADKLPLIDLDMVYKWKSFLQRFPITASRPPTRKFRQQLLRESSPEVSFEDLKGRTLDTIINDHRILNLCVNQLIFLDRPSNRKPYKVSNLDHHHNARLLKQWISDFKYTPEVVQQNADLAHLQFLATQEILESESALIKSNEDAVQSLHSKLFNEWQDIRKLVEKTAIKKLNKVFKIKDNCLQLRWKTILALEKNLQIKWQDYQSYLEVQFDRTSRPTSAEFLQVLRRATILKGIILKHGQKISPFEIFAAQILHEGKTQFTPYESFSLQTELFGIETKLIKKMKADEWFQNERFKPSPYKTVKQYVSQRTTHTRLFRSYIIGHCVDFPSSGSNHEYHEKMVGYLRDWVKLPKLQERSFKTILDSHSDRDIENLIHQQFQRETGFKKSENSTLYARWCTAKSNFPAQFYVVTLLPIKYNSSSTESALLLVSRKPITSLTQLQSPWTIQWPLYRHLKRILEGELIAKDPLNTYSTQVQGKECMHTIIAHYYERARKTFGASITLNQIAHMITTLTSSIFPSSQHDLTNLMYECWAKVRDHAVSFTDLKFSSVFDQKPIKDFIITSRELLNRPFAASLKDLSTDLDPLTFCRKVFHIASRDLYEKNETETGDTIRKWIVAFFRFYFKTISSARVSTFFGSPFNSLRINLDPNGTIRCQYAMDQAQIFPSPNFRNYSHRVGIDLGVRELYHLDHSGHFGHCDPDIDQVNQDVDHLKQISDHLRSTSQHGLRRLEAREATKSVKIGRLIVHTARLDQHRNQLLHHAGHMSTAALLSSINAVASAFPTEIVLEDLQNYQANKGQFAAAKTEWIRGKVAQYLTEKSQLTNSKITMVPAWYTSKIYSQCHQEGQKGYLIAIATSSPQSKRRILTAPLEWKYSHAVNLRGTGPLSPLNCSTEIWETESPEEFDKGRLLPAHHRQIERFLTSLSDESDESAGENILFLPSNAGNCFYCSNCRQILDRDENAARNLTTYNKLRFRAHICNLWKNRIAKMGGSPGHQKFTYHFARLQYYLRAALRYKAQNIAEEGWIKEKPTSSSFYIELHALLYPHPDSRFWDLLESLCNYAYGDTMQSKVNLHFVQIKRGNNPFKHIQLLVKLLEEAKRK